MERIPFEIFEDAEREVDLERMRGLTNLELVDFINDATTHIEGVSDFVEMSIEVLLERGFDIELEDE